MNPYSLPNFFAAILILSTGILVFLKNNKSRVHILFLLSTISAFIWQLGTGLALSAKNPSAALPATRIAFIGIALIPVFTYHLCLCVSGANNDKAVVFGYLLAVLCFIPLSLTSLVLNGVNSYSWGFFFKAGPLHPIFLVFFIYFMFALLFHLFLSYRNERNPLEKNRKKYFLIGLMIAYVGSIDYLPTYGIPVYSIGYLGPICFVLIFAYAILKYRLMDINIVLTRAGIFSIVYALVLGIPFGLTAWGKNWLMLLFGQAWFWIPMFLLLLLATVGPFVYQSLRRRAEDVIFKEQRRYQHALRELSRAMAHIRDLNLLLKTITSTITDNVKTKFAAIYIKDEEYKSYKLSSFSPKEENTRFQEFISLDHVLATRLNEKKRPITSEEVGQQDKIDLDSGMFIPCFVEDSLLAFIVLGAKPNSQMYTSDDALIFETLSYSASLAIENCIFWKEIEERQRQARLHEMDIFSYSLAHEIDNPMTIIKGQASFVKKELPTLNLPQEKLKELTESLDYILDAQDRTSSMIKAIEDYGKPVTADLVPLKLEDVVTAFLRLYTPQLKHHGIHLATEIAPDLPYVKGIKQELVQVLVNLSNNALHAMLGAQEKRLSLNISLPSADFARITFKDNGYGIVVEKLRAIFAPFVTTKASTEGRGMGLYNCKKIIEHHRGKIWAESEGKGKGATFVIELPVAKDITPEELREKGKSKRLF